MSNIVAIVGRPNVGKSTFFNRLTESRSAIVDEVAGVTRDRHYGKALWNGIEFSVVDTGGYVEGSDDIFEEAIRKQVLIAIDESDVIVFMVDNTTGITAMDQSIADILRRRKKKIFLVVNKVDEPAMAFEADVFYALGLGDPYKISSVNGSGTGDLLDDIVKNFERNPEKEEADLPRIAVVGRPNVGKSTLINTLLGEERYIVTPIAGTTRDSIYTLYNKYNHKFYLVDTAGIRKKGKITENIEFYSVMRSIKAIEYADVCLLMIDATRGIEAQDINIFSLIQRNNKGIVILVNKWDMVTKDHRTAQSMESEIKKKIAPFTDVPVIFISAINKQRIHKILETAMQVYNNRIKRVSTSQLNEVMQKAIEEYPPPSFKGKFIKIKYVAQLPTHAPSFAFYCNFPQYIREPYKRYLENKLRNHFNFTGVPLQIFIRKK
jgi:GTP-binding protein